MRKAYVIELNKQQDYQRLIPGVPDSCGMKSGRVWLAPGGECGVHSTHGNEEQLVFLAGEGTADIAGEKLSVGVGKICYIPPHTEHNIVNTGEKPMVYIYCVAAAQLELKA